MSLPRDFIRITGMVYGIHHRGGMTAPGAVPNNTGLIIAKFCCKRNEKNDGLRRMWGRNVGDFVGGGGKNGKWRFFIAL